MTVVEETSQYIHWRSLVVIVLCRVKDPAGLTVVLFIFVAQAKWMSLLIAHAWKLACWLVSEPGCGGLNWQFKYFESKIYLRCV